jgi:hypothetical protein
MCTQRMSADRVCLYLFVLMIQLGNISTNVMARGMDVIPLVAIQTSYFYILRLVITIWRVPELLRRK